MQGRTSISVDALSRGYMPKWPAAFETFDRTSMVPAAEGQGAGTGQLASAGPRQTGARTDLKTEAKEIDRRHRRRVETFIGWLLDDRSDRCQRAVGSVLAETGNPQHVVRRLLEPAAQILGDKWFRDEFNFVQVTLAVSRMQRLFHRMVSDVPPAVSPRSAGCALLAPAPGEQHTFGLSVAADAFRRAGWEVDCCGCEERHDLFRLTANNHYNVVGVSLSVERRLPETALMVEKLRSVSRNRSLIVIVGGGIAEQDPQGAADAGFDLVLGDAASAPSQLARLATG